MRNGKRYQIQLNHYNIGDKKEDFILLDYLNTTRAIAVRKAENEAKALRFRTGREVYIADVKEV